jgi:SAM-dependent methyltransferase
VKWKLKAGLQNVIAALPFYSHAIYFGVQRSGGGLRPDRINPLSRMSAAAERVAWAESIGVDVKGSTVLEVGTGHMVDLPIGMWLCGAARVITVDLNPYLSRELISEARSFVRRNPDQVVQLFVGRQNRLFDERLGVLIGNTIPDDKLLDAMNIDYMSPADAANLPLEAHSVDLHVSNTVLEHIPQDVLSSILTEARRILRPGGLLIHKIDPSDHFAHDDAAITRINFLRFTDLEWKGLAGNRFMYHNRLRAPDYLQLFEENGVQILKDERVIDERSKVALGSGFPVDARFRGVADDDLATTTISLMGRFS